MSVIKEYTYKEAIDSALRVIDSYRVGVRPRMKLYYLVGSEDWCVVVRLLNYLTEDVIKIQGTEDQFKFKFHFRVDNIIKLEILSN